MDKVLILGAGGMLGQALASAFSDRNPVLLGHDDLDITREERVLRKIGITKPKVIINAAAYTKVDQAERDEDAAVLVNAEAVKYVARAAAANRSLLVHFSTDYVCPGDDKRGYTENSCSDPEDAMNVYGYSKALGEFYLLEEAAGFEFPYYIVRTSWLYGPGGGNFVNTMLALGKKNPALAVVDDQHGSPTYTVDLAKAIRAMIEQKIEPGIYHRTNDGTTTWCDFAREIFNLANLAVSVTPQTTGDYMRGYRVRHGFDPAPRPIYSTLLSTKLPPLRPWQDALAEYIASRKLSPV